MVVEIMKYYLQDMSWMEIQEALKRTDTVIVPIGNLEQHGPQSPVGCCLYLAQETSKHVGNKTHVPVTPTIPVGISNPYKNFPGSLNVSTEVFNDLVKEVCMALIHHGFQRIIFFSAHGGGNLPTLQRVSEELREETGVLCAIIHLWGLLGQLSPEIRTAPGETGGHGGDPVTSVMLYLKPELVDMTKARWVPLKTPLEGLESIHHSTHKFKNINILIPLFGEEVSEIGVYGNPMKASKERGGRLFNTMIDYLVEFVQNFEKMKLPIVSKDTFK
jgi:creatinine amidohydrolase